MMAHSGGVSNSTATDQRGVEMYMPSLRKGNSQNYIVFNIRSSANAIIMLSFLYLFFASHLTL